jgi:hypothetical protein
LLGALRICFFKADKSKMVDCVSISAATRHIVAPISATNTHPNSQRRFCCQAYYFTLGLQFQAAGSSKGGCTTLARGAGLCLIRGLEDLFDELVILDE